MNPEKQRIAIAEACGWKLQNGTIWVNPNGYGSWMGDSIKVLPNYLMSLDAIHHAMESIVRGPDVHEFQSNEILLDNEIEKIAEDLQIPVWMLDAKDYCEALLKFLGKWKE